MTAFLHTQLRHSRKGEYGIISPALGMVSFVAVVFATFTTRAGSIWTASVHAFGNSQGTTAGDRLSYLLQHDSTILGIFVLMLFLFFLAVYLAYDKYRSRSRTESEPEPDRFSEYISDKNNMFLTVALLLVTSAVMLLLLFKNVNASQTANMDEFNQKMSLFFVFLMVTMSICLVWKSLGKEVAFWLGAGMLVVSVVLAVLSAASGAFDWLVAFSLPSYVVAVCASAYRMARSKVSGSARKTLQKMSPQIVHLGVAMVLVSFVISSNMQVFPSDLQNLSGVSGKEVAVGGDVKVGSYTIHLSDMRAEARSISSGGMSIDQARLAVLDLAKSGKTVRSSIVLTNLYGLDSSGKPAVMKVEVYIYKSVLGDLYMDYQWIDDSTAFIQVKEVPMMNFLWAGFGLLAIGLAIRTIVWRQEPKELPERAERAEPAPAIQKKARVQPAKDYEALVEEELRKFKEKRSK